MNKKMSDDVKGKLSSLLVLPRISQNYLNDLSYKSEQHKKRLIYECYKPRDLEEVKEYIRFVVDYRSIVPNEVTFYTSKHSPTETIPDISFDNPPLGLSQKLTAYLKATGKQRKDPKNKGILWFDSNFECGNLERAIIKNENEYELYLNSDTNSIGMYLWFYFSVENTKAKQTIRFHIMNLTKYSRFYAEHGMLPSVFSETDYKMNIGWNQNNITNCQLIKNTNTDYVPRGRSIPINGYTAENERKEGTYCLSFTYTFKHKDDKVYFAFFTPYSFTRLYRVFSKIETKLFQDSIRANCENINSLLEIQIETRNLLYKRIQICKTSGNVPVDCIIISSSKPSTHYIVITARVHSAETPGSYNVEEIIEYLLGSSKIAGVLRKQYTFFIIPMLNPDGVILGNTRYSAEGDDLNRCWDNPSPIHHPAVYNLKELLRTLTDKGEIKVYCDLHGHSKKFNSFIYACHHVLSATHDSWNSTRMLTRIMARACNTFDYNQCSFEIKPDKLNTARVVIWKEFKVMHSFTLETSMYGYTLNGNIVKFEDKEYLFIGKALMLSLYEYGIILGKLNDSIIKITKTIEEDQKAKKDPNDPKQSSNKTEAYLKDKIQKPRSKSNLSKSEVLKHMSSPGRRKKEALILAECLEEKHIRNNLPAINSNLSPLKFEGSTLFEELQSSGKTNKISFLATHKKNKKIIDNSRILSTLSKRAGLRPVSNKQYGQFSSYWKLRNDHKELLSTIYEKNYRTKDRVMKQEFPLNITTALIKKHQVVEHTSQDNNTYPAHSFVKRHNKSLEECHTQYVDNKAFLRSTFIFSNDNEMRRDKGFVKSYKETGLKNLTKKLTNTVNEGSNIEAYKLKIMNSLDDPTNPVFLFNLSKGDARRAIINHNLTGNIGKPVSPRKCLKSKRLIS